MEPKNLLFIMSDQHSRGIAGCYGNSVARTPNIDTLAAGGTRFTNAYCNVPICVPSRASFATGRYAHEIRSWDNASPYTGAEAPSWGHRLTDQGHQVTTIGKLHYRSVDDANGFPDERLPLHVVDGIGDLYGLLRGDMPVRPSGRKYVDDAGPGDSEYIRYDRAIAQDAAHWLSNEGREQDQPWALFVSFVTPHFPLIVPEEYFNLYPLDSLPMPVQYEPDNWPMHPAIDLHRRLGGYGEPFDERAIRHATAAYYGLVSFLDEQIGKVLEALADAGLDDDTRIIYTSDHGEVLGNRGIWGKCTMYEEAAGIPLILSGPDVPAGEVVTTNASLVDAFPSILDAVGAEAAPEDADLPGTSWWDLTDAGHQSRLVFGEYHAIFSKSGFYMVRDDRYKYVYYVDDEPQLFDLISDPQELNDLAADPDHADARMALEQALRSIVDPEEVDRQAKADQSQILERHGGPAAVLAAGSKIPYTPAPVEFNPDPDAAKS